MAMNDKYLIDHSCDCGVDSSKLNHSDYELLIHHQDERMHDWEKSSLPVKCECGNDMKTVVNQTHYRKIDAIFDFHFQVWRNRKGRSIPEQSGWVHSCPKCNGPSDMTGYDAYNEYHCCLNCNFRFAVN